MATNTPYSAFVTARARRTGVVVFDVRWRENGGSKTRCFETDKAAQKWAGLMRKIGPTEAVALLETNTAPDAITVAEYAETYINGKSGVEGKTTDHYRMYMRLHIGPVIGHLPLEAVTAGTIAAWINGQAGAAAKTIKNRHGFLAAMFQSAVEDKLLDRNPCARSSLPASESLEMVFLSPNEFTHLLAYTPTFWQPLVLFLVATGLRWGEATALRPSDFDLEDESVRVSRAWKSSQAQGWYIGAPKTKRSKRTVSLPADLIPHIRPLVEGGTEYVFTNKFGRPIRQPNFLDAVWNPTRRLANGLPAFETKTEAAKPWEARSNSFWFDREPAAKPLGKYPRVHDLRHTHASWLLAAGVGLDIIQRRLGHESITTTVDRYGHISPERQRSAADAVGRSMAGAMPSLMLG